MKSMLSVLFLCLPVHAFSSPSIKGYACKYQRIDHSFSIVGISPQQDDYTQIYAYNACADAQHSCTISCEETNIRQRASGKWVRGFEGLRDPSEP